MSANIHISNIKLGIKQNYHVHCVFHQLNIVKTDIRWTNLLGLSSQPGFAKRGVSVSLKKQIVRANIKT